MHRLLFIYILTLFMLSNAFYAGAQGIQSTFGKNRVQYGTFDWYFYRTSDFEVYYYGGGRNLAQYVLTHAGSFLREIEKKIDYQSGRRITFVIYNTYSDYLQSNITLVDESYNTGGYTPVVDNIAFVYFDGDHVQFDKRVKMSLSEVLLNELIFGSSIQERIQNMVLINLPEWYYNGLISYLSGEVPVQQREEFENGIEYERFRKFGGLKPEDKILIGHFFWEYIATVYGTNAISNILYLTHINKNIESGFDFVLGKPFQLIYAEWYRFYRYQILSRETDKFQAFDHIYELSKLPKNKEITQAKLSADGSKIAFVFNKRGRSAVVFYDLDNGKRKTIMRKGYRMHENLYDKSYPLIAWHPNSEMLTIIYEHRAEPIMTDYLLEKKTFDEKRKLDNLDKVLDFSYNARGNNLVLSAIRQGSSDIFVYEKRSFRLLPVTNDIFDDLNPRFVFNDKGIVFSSNRSETALQRAQFDPENKFSQSFDIYYYDLEKRDKQLKRVSFSELYNASHPNAYNDKYISYLTNENGIVNRNAAYLDSIFRHIFVHVNYNDSLTFPPDSFYFYQNDLSLIHIPDIDFKDSLISSIDTFVVFADTAYSFHQSNYLRNIRFYDISRSSSTVFEVFKDNNRYFMQMSPIPDELEKSFTQRKSTYHITHYYKERTKDRGLFETGERERTKIKTATVEEETIKEQPLDSFRYGFITPFDRIIVDTTEDKESGQRIFVRRADVVQAGSTRDTVADLRRTRFGSASSYFLSFTPDYLVSQFDNSFLNSPYLLYYPNDPIQPINNIANAFFMLGVTDLFKDYKISGGFRIKGNLRGADYIMAFENLKRRMDKKLIFYRSGETIDNMFTRIRRLTYEGRIQLSYPFSRITALKSDIFIRQDREITLASERNTLLLPDELTTYAGFRLEYVYDNSLIIGQNSRIGSRSKLYYENFRNYTDFNDAFTVFGGDYRKYIRIHKELIWANRFAFSSSTGNSKVAFIMGGVENWLFPSYNQDIQIDPDINYIYRTLAAQMRGFSQNIRNGNSYALINSELRFPIFRYFSPLPMRSSFWENFMFVAFGDIGTAWTGSNPFSESNALNKRIIYNNPLKITVTTIGDPLVWGFGLGIRANLFGYYVKLDHAWGVESFQIFQRVTYLSIGLDF